MAMGMLSDEERARLVPAELAANPTPVPTQVVSSDEFLPVPQTERQRKVEARMNALADDYGKKNGLPRRRFFQTAAGMATAIVTPGYPGWMDEVDRAIATLKPDSWKGYTVGDNTNKDLSTHPWRMDDEKLVYPFYEKIVKAGYDIVCVHKGLYPPSTEQRWPNLTGYATVDDVGKAAKDWPQIRF